MPTAIVRYYEVIKWTAEFLMLPLHYLALNHMYATATALGGVVLVAYVALSVKHAQLERVNINSGEASSN